nr:ATP-grasp domain-containing protein [Caldalkalibacillus salinus]
MLENDYYITFVGAPYFNSYAKLVHQNVIYDTSTGHDDLYDLLDTINHQHPFDAAVTFSELDVELTAKISERYQLISISPETAKLCRNKYLMRTRFEHYDLPQPRFEKVKSADDISSFLHKLNKPAVLKPTDNGGSVGVIKITGPDDQQISEKYQDTLNVSKNQTLLIEEFIEGEEFSIEVIVQHAVPQVITVVDKAVAGKDQQHFVEVGHTVPSLQPVEVQEALKELAIKGVNALGMENGVAHVEIKKSNNTYYLIEIGARSAGDNIPLLIEKSYEWNYYNAILDVALGQKYSSIPDKASYYASISYFFGDTGKRVTSFPKIKDYHQEVEEIKYSVKIGDTIRPLHANYTRMGYVMFKVREPYNIKDMQTVFTKKFSPMTE